jgi:hypothetical protein
MGNMGKGHLYLTLREQPAATGIAIWRCNLFYMNHKDTLCRMGVIPHSETSLDSPSLEHIAANVDPRPRKLDETMTCVNTCLALT